jgi:hypothetical protein
MLEKVSYPTSNSLTRFRGMAFRFKDDLVDELNITFPDWSDLQEGLREHDRVFVRNLLTIYEEEMCANVLAALFSLNPGEALSAEEVAQCKEIICSVRHFLKRIAVL